MIGPTMTPEILARIAAARAARDLSDLARQEVGTTAETTSPTERIERARRMRTMLNAYVDLVVLAEALAGADWREIAEALGRRDPGTVAEEFAVAGAPSPRRRPTGRPPTLKTWTPGMPGTARTTTLTSRNLSLIY
ncbi:hypothetical protein M2271_006506 [Streptomyces sp. LBL]|uniref:hypothetical protein n=1 Tax=Streptomyces sp. LBL TaxID=2940562 RepID=UPI002476230B|nr:hypothetical protein [Streptomyces sp. LBL]MDH6628673.1 hypothetical protein [Streptomyces sp. LBL]